MKYFIYLTNIFVALIFSSCSVSEEEEVGTWYFRSFSRSEINPVLVPEQSSVFYCPVRKDSVFWEYKDVFNPAAVIRGNVTFLLYRAEDTVGRYNGTSRIGIATSRDGIQFQRAGAPVLYPDNDFMRRYEWEGGVEDPRVVMSEEGKYIMTYTAYDGSTARLCVATSEDLITWEKTGLAFKARRYRDLWSKSGSIVAKFDENNNLVATKINDKYWMYWGDTKIFAASSDNLTDWTPLTDRQGRLVEVFGPRKFYFDSRLVEPGPPAIVTNQGILLLYNGMNLDSLGRDDQLVPGTYSAGQALLSLDNPAQTINRSSQYFLTPEDDFEIAGQIGNVCFIEGLVKFNGSYFLYYGTADSKIGLVTSSDKIDL